LDNAAPTKLQSKAQYCISKILIAHSLFRRGFNHFSLLKKVFIYLSALLLPFQRSFFVFVKKFNGTKSTLYSTFFTISRWHNVFIEEEMLGSGVLLNFENMLLPVPEKYHEYLQMTYGDYMRFPSESERYKSIHAVIIDVNNSYEKYL
jgi:phosphorylcholine metabolism protein LicD